MIRKICLLSLLLTVFLSACGSKTETTIPLAPPVPTQEEQAYPAPGSIPTQPAFNILSFYPAPGDVPQFMPQLSDESMVRGEVTFDAEISSLVITESAPVQVGVLLSGFLPTPCHQLRAIISEPDDQKRIHIELYSVVDENEVCTQVIVPFEVRFNLGSFSPGKYQILVNGELFKEFDS